MSNKPGILLPLAWSFIVGGVFLAVGGAAGLALAGPLKAHPEQSLVWNLVRDLPDAETLWSTMTAWLVPSSWAQIVLGFLFCWAGADLLRLKPWARAFLEWGSWASAAGLVFVSILMTIHGARLLDAMAGEDGASGGFLFFYWMGMLSVTALLTAPLVTTALLLRRKDVCAAISRSRPSYPEGRSMK
jgi:hypothetical protein